MRISSPRNPLRSVSPGETGSLPRTAGLTLLCLLVVACGGSGGGGSAAPPPPAGGTPPPGGSGDGAQTALAMGTITGFGSIFVNGVEYETQGAEIEIEGLPGVEDDLAVGQIAIVTASRTSDGSAVATRVVVDSTLEGPVTSIDTVAGTLIVLGQTVQVDAGTSFDDSIAPASLAGLAAGDLIEVHGLPGADGVIVASRIEPAGTAAEFELHGFVAGLDTAASRFLIGALSIDYSAALLEDFPGGVISAGDPVEVHGQSFGPGGELLATRIEYDAPLAGEAGAQVEVEGFITRFVSASDFDIGATTVNAGAQTQYENGTAADLALNVKVEAEGVFDEGGILQAEKISLRAAMDVRISAPVVALDLAAGTLELLGVGVRVDSLTRLEDASEADLPRFAFADLSVGDFVEIRGTEEPPASDTVAVARLSREDLEEEVILQGRVDVVGASDLVILGVVIQTGAGTEYRDAADVPLAADAFFGAVATGMLVKAKGMDLGGGVLAAEELEFQNPQDD